MSKFLWFLWKTKHGTGASCAQLQSVSSQSQVRDQGATKEKHPWLEAAFMASLGSRPGPGLQGACSLVYLLQGAPSHVPLVSVECQGISSSAKGGRLNDPTFASPHSAYYQPKSWHNWPQAGSTGQHSIKSEVPDQHGCTWHRGFRTLLGCEICDMSSHLLSTRHAIPAWPFQESSPGGREAWSWGSHSKDWC